MTVEQKYITICYVQSIITTTRGPLKWSALREKLFTADCYVFLFNSHYLYGYLSILILLILSRDTHEEVHFLLLSIYPQKSPRLIIFILNFRGTFLLSEKLNLLICGTFKHNMFLSVKEIHNLSFLINNNSFRYFLLDEHGVLCMSIPGIILRSALVLFSLLCAISYHYYKGPLKLEFFKFKTMHSILFCISVQHSISL